MPASACASGWRHDATWWPVGLKKAPSRILPWRLLTTSSLAAVFFGSAQPPCAPGAFDWRRNLRKPYRDDKCSTTVATTVYNGGGGPPSSLMQGNTMITRRTILAVAAVSGLFLGAAAPAVAQSYPDRPIKLIVPFAPGGPMDTMARFVGQQLQMKLGQPVVVENRAGAGGAIGSKAVV